MINDPQYSIYGLKLLGGSKVRIQCFAEDTTLVLKILDKTCVGLLM
jgi:hypothetical protein